MNGSAFPKNAYFVCLLTDVHPMGFGPKKKKILLMVFNEKILLKHPFDIHIITFVTGIIYEVRNITFHSNVVILTTLLYWRLP